MQASIPEPPFTLALDVGTSSIRALVCDSKTCPIEATGIRLPYRMTLTPDGGVEIDADLLLDLVCRAIDGSLLALAPGQPIAAVGCCTFWHAMLGVDGNGRAITPLYSWNDTRSAPDARELRARLGPWVHQETGSIPHSSYYSAKIAWLKRTNPSFASRVSRWVSVGEYLYSKLFGEFVCGVSMASATGLLNLGKNMWSEAMLREVGLDAGQLSRIAEDGEALTRLRPEFAKRWPALRNAQWLPACGDGAASNIGSGCFTRERIALNVGTSGAMRVCFCAKNVDVPDGLWCYRASHDRAVLGGALSNAGDALIWCAEILGIDPGDAESSLGMSGQEHGLSALPFFSGERSTGWQDDARAAITELSLATRPSDIFAAVLESVCYRFAAVYDLISPHCRGAAQVVASGGAVRESTVWPRVLADILAVPVEVSPVAEASCLGAAMLAMKALGIVEGLDAVRIPQGPVFEPDKTRRDQYLRGRERHEMLYDRMRG